MPIFPGLEMPANTAKEKAAKARAWKIWIAAEERRVRRQRHWLSGAGPVRKGLIEAMLERAWALLDSGDAEAAEALLEFVPAQAAEALLREFFDE